MVTEIFRLLEFYLRICVCGQGGPKQSPDSRTAAALQKRGCEQLLELVGGTCLVNCDFPDFVLLSALPILSQST
jgi:hypothetical protein